MAIIPQFLYTSTYSNYKPCSNYLPFSFHYSNFHAHFNPKHSTFVCLASTKKARPSRKLISDEELCNGLMEFVGSVGLPEGHVPSTKELAQHGRIDLANIVRRRGHKLVKELLVNATKPATDEYDSLENFKGEFNGSRTREEKGQEEKLTDGIEESIDLINDDSSIEGKVTNDIEESVDLINDDSSVDEKVTDAIEASINLINDDSSVDVSVGTTSESTDCFDNESPLSVESSVSLQEKVEQFMRYGQLNAVEDDGDNREPHDDDDFGHFTDDSWSSTESNGALMLQRSISTTEENYTRENHLSTESQQNTDFDPEMSSGSNKMNNEVEIDRLKLMLHQKELELSRLKNEIENEKKALSVLQTKAEDEINKAQQLITEKEAELQAAEESLSGLVEAKIYYAGEGQMVEVAGSFNGWHQRIKLDPQISSVVGDPTDSRKSKLWSATLWLYPGVYEMKFIVDGQWRIDPRREISIRHGVENNVLRVDR